MKNTDKEKVLINLDDAINRLCMLSGLHINAYTDTLKQNDAIIIEDCLTRLIGVINSIKGREDE